MVLDGSLVALCVAGRTFHGMKVDQGGVCYVAADGHARELGERVLAWWIENQVEASSLAGRSLTVSPMAQKQGFEPRKPPCPSISLSDIGAGFSKLAGHER